MERKQTDRLISRRADGSTDRTDPLSQISGIRRRPQQQAACQIGSTGSQIDRRLTAASMETDRAERPSQVFEHKQRISRVLGMEVMVNKTPSRPAPQHSRSKQRNDFTLVSN